MHLRHHLVSLLAVIFLSLTIYGNSLNNGFTADDAATIITNQFIKDIANVPKLFHSDYFALFDEISYRPVCTFTYFLEFALFGLKPCGYHLTNLLIHTINGVMVYLLACLLVSTTDNVPVRERRFLANTPLLVSLLFVSHPILTEAVNAISYREDLLMFFLYVSTLLFYISLSKGIAHRKPLYLLSCVAYFFALFSKEMAATLPIVVYIYDSACNGKGKYAYLRVSRYNVGYIAITLAYLYVRFFYFYNPVESNLRPWGLAVRLMTIPWITLSNLKMSIFPFCLTADYNIVPVKSVFTVKFIAPLTSVILVLFTTYIARKDLFFSILFFFITLIPVYNIIPIGHPFAERYLYLPAAGIAFVAGLSVRALSSVINTRILLPLFFVILFIFSLSTERRNYVWRDDYSLWSDTARKMPDSSVAHSELGKIYVEQGKLGPAIAELTTAAMLSPKDPTLHLTLGNIYARQRRFEDAIKEYQNALRIKRDYYEARLALKDVVIQRGFEITRRSGR